MHTHEWRNWPYSSDIVCIGCGYMVIGGAHYPNGKWPQDRQTTNPTPAPHPESDETR